MKYRYFKHTADIKYRAYGDTIEKVFVNSALAMFNSMYHGEVDNKITKKISVRGKDLESLMYNFLEKLLILMDSKDFFVSEVRIKIDKSKFILKGEIVGDKISNYDIGLTIKAVTFNDMFIKKTGGRYVSQVVLDV